MARQSSDIIACIWSICCTSPKFREYQPMTFRVILLINTPVPEVIKLTGVVRKTTRLARSELWQAV